MICFCSSRVISKGMTCKRKVELLKIENKNILKIRGLMISNKKERIFGQEGNLFLTIPTPQQDQTALPGIRNCQDFQGKPSEKSNLAQNSLPGFLENSIIKLWACPHFNLVEFNTIILKREAKFKIFFYPIVRNIIYSQNFFQVSVIRSSQYFFSCFSNLIHRKIKSNFIFFSAGMKGFL